MVVVVVVVVVVAVVFVAVVIVAVVVIVLLVAVVVVGVVVVVIVVVDRVVPAVESYAPEAPGIHGGISGILPLPSTVSSIAGSTAGVASVVWSSFVEGAVGAVVVGCFRFLVAGWKRKWAG